MTAHAIALSGPDNVGKTTQLRLLARRAGPAHMTPAGPLDDYDRRWPTIKKIGMANWWFTVAPIKEVVDVLACSYLERERSATGDVRLVDRGVPMLEATVAATVAVREQLGDRHAADRARQLLSAFSGDLAAAESDQHGVVLLHDENPATGAARALAREPSTTLVYAEYQRCLNEQVQRLLAEGRFAETVVTGERSIFDIQIQLRSLLKERFHDVPGSGLNTVRVVALGGLSECGKSTAGEYLRLRHGFARLKIGHLIEDAAARHGYSDVYMAGPTVLAELITDSLDRFCAAHHFIDRVSIESLHSSEVTCELKKILGDRLAVVFLDTDSVTRAHRGTAGPEDVRRRDVVKRERGAAEIVGIADHVVNNDGLLLTLHRRLDLLALAGRWPETAPPTVAVNSLGLPVHLESYLSELLDRITSLTDLVAVTGSGARGKYQHGWSDLDVFVIAEAASLDRLRSALDEVAAELGGVKLGLTVVTRAECRTGAVSSRLLHVLALLGTGEVTPLWRAPGVAIAAPDAATDIRESLRDGVQAAIEIRRQLVAPQAETRALYKLTALLAKIMLRFEGVEMPGDNDALRQLLKDSPGDRLEQCSEAVDRLGEGVPSRVIDSKVTE